MDNLIPSALHEEGAWLKLKGLDGKETSVRIKLKGIYSKAWRESKRLFDAQNRIYLQLLKAEKFTEAEEYKGSMLTIERMVAGVTVDWENMPDPWSDADYLEFNKDNAEKIYDAAPNIFDQCDAFFSNSENFMLDSPKK